MSSDARLALEALTTALNEHLVAAQNKRGEDDPTVEAAFFAVADAFENYEDALYADTEEVTPLDLFDDDEDDDQD
ncbi:hypothetical protein AAG742_06135 [Micrococcus sp. 2A]|uniref:hypothetical protein n=1 Tax=Micrococcus TaxID=1269 RepID=UPI00200642D6|nr:MULTISPECIES: hypothetical protein [unclassified Micrococcus]MCK6094804.1 hypothetical protein [Micrococcus sp. EYE_212]MCK6170751.1 hypothetical protein [Micrococcus sp. EYE_162]MDX2340483.1 hypothetical protein [Micrococcus sp. M4NT]